MKKVLTFLAMLYLLSMDAQTIIEHVAKSKNTNGHITTINNPTTNGKEDVILVVTQKYGVYNDNEIGVWYNGGTWKIFNQNKKAMPINAKFNILVLPKKTKQSFVHTTTGPNTSGHISTLNSTLVNEKPDALIFLTQNYGKYNTSNVGLWYTGGKWKIYNENKSQKMPIGTKFNVVVLNPERNKIGDLDLFAFKYKNNSSGHISTINSPLQFTNTTTLFTTPNWIDTYNPNITGVWKNGTKWTVFNQNRKTLPKKVQFNVLATNKPQEAVVIPSTDNTPTDAKFVIDDFATGNFDTKIFDNGLSENFYQKGTSILGGLRRVHVKVGENIYNQKPQLTVNANNELAYSSGYDVNSTLYLSYGYDKNGAKKLNKNLARYKILKIEFTAKSAKTGMYLTMFTNNNRAVYSNHVPEREGKLIFEIPLNELRIIGETFTLTDVDHMIFQFDSRSKTGCNMAINKIWFE